MKIGMTYDLRNEYLDAGFSEEETAEFDRDDTITSLEGALQELGHETVRIGHSRRLVECLVQGDRWDLVFNLAEGMYGIGREAQVPNLLDMYQIPYTFSDPLVSALTLHKGMTKRVVRDAGVPTPDFCIVEKPSDADDVRLSIPCFVKPVAEGTGKGVTQKSVVRKREDLRPLCDELLIRFKQPVLVESYLPGREFTVGILGTATDAQALGTMEVILLPEAEKEVYSYINKEKCEELVQYVLRDGATDPLIQNAEEVSLAAWRVLGCRDAGRVDIRCDDSGNPQFIEVNPLAGLHPEHSDLPILCNMLGFPYTRLIERIVQSASERVTTGSAG